MALRGPAPPWVESHHTEGRAAAADSRLGRSWLLLSVLQFDQQLDLVDGLTKILQAVLPPVTADALHDTPLQECQLVGGDELNRLNGVLLVVVASNLLL